MAELHQVSSYFTCYDIVDIRFQNYILFVTTDMMMKLINYINANFENITQSHLVRNALDSRYSCLSNAKPNIPAFRGFKCKIQSLRSVCYKTK